MLGVEETLGYLDVPLVLHKRIKASHSLGDASWTCLVTADPEIRDSRNDAYQGVFRTNYLFYKAKVVTEWTFVDSDPLMSNDRSFFHLRASLHDLSHFCDRDHAQASRVDASHAPRQLLNMRELVGLDKDDPRGVLRLENLHHHERMSLVEIVDQLVSQTEDELALHSRLNFESPKLGVHIGGQVDIATESFSVNIHHLIAIKRHVVFLKVFVLDIHLVFF